MSDSSSPLALLKTHMADPKTYKMVVSVALLFLFFLAYGLVQERIMTKPYGNVDGADVFFKTSAFLVFNNRLVTMVVAALLAKRAGESIKPAAPLYTYFGASLSNFAATFCQYEALKYVSFPTQTLGKCGKIIPVLVLGTLGLGVKKYGKHEYLEGLLVTAGAAVFLMTGDTKAPQTQHDDSVYGLALMAGYLFCDGFTSTLQEKMFKGFTMSSYNMMIYVNMSSAILSVLTLMGQQKFFSSIDFCMQYPQIVVDAFGLSLCAMFGQQVIYYIIKNFGALVFATAMTTRQFAAILLSSFIYFHPLSAGQYAGVALVFSALYWKAVRKGRAASKKADTAASEEAPAGTKV